MLLRKKCVKQVINAASVRQVPPPHLHSTHTHAHMRMLMLMLMRMHMGTQISVQAYTYMCLHAPFTWDSAFIFIYPLTFIKLQEKMTNPLSLACTHIFCEKCISEWFERNRTCPLCRAVVKTAGNLTHSDGSSGMSLVLF